MTTIGDGFKDVFLAGIGAMAITAEKGKELVDQLIEKGELTVDQGKQINTELKHKAEAATTAVRDDVLEARMAAMTAEERAAFVAKAAEIAQKVDARGEAQVGDASSVKAEAAPADAEGEESQDSSASASPAAGAGA